MGDTWVQLHEAKGSDIDAGPRTSQEQLRLVNKKKLLL